MKFRKALAAILNTVALLLSHAMCAVVAYLYCDMVWGIKYACYSAPVWTAFLVAVPFLLVIILLLVFAKKLKNKKAKETETEEAE